MKPFAPKTDRERLAFEAGRAQGLHEAIAALGLRVPSSETAPATGPRQGHMRLEKLLLSAGFTRRRPDDDPFVAVYQRGQEELAVDVDEVRWFGQDMDEPETLTLEAAAARLRAAR